MLDLQASRSAAHPAPRASQGSATTVRAAQGPPPLVSRAPDSCACVLPLPPPLASRPHDIADCPDGWYAGSGIDAITCYKNCGGAGSRAHAQPRTTSGLGSATRSTAVVPCPTCILLLSVFWLCRLCSAHLCTTAQEADSCQPALTDPADQQHTTFLHPCSLELLAAGAQLHFPAVHLRPSWPVLF